MLKESKLPEVNINIGGGVYLKNIDIPVFSILKNSKNIKEK